MSWLMALLAPLPEPLHVVVLGAIGAAIGIGASTLATRWSDHRGLALALIVVPVIGLPALVFGLVGRQSAETAGARIIAALKDQPLLAATLASEPDLEAALRRRITQRARTTRDAAALIREAETLASELAFERFNALAPDASDEAILRYQHLSLKVLEQLKADPVDCVAFIGGKPTFDTTRLDAALRQEEAVLRARIIREGAARTTPFRTPLSDDDLRHSLAIGYQMTGRDPKSGARLANLDADPKAGCAAALDYMTAVSSLEAKRASKVFKTLLLRRQTP